MAEQFMDMVGCDRATADMYMEMSGGNMELAMNIFFGTTCGARARVTIGRLRRLSPSTFKKKNRGIHQYAL